jgi:hypothetical protein
MLLVIYVSLQYYCNDIRILYQMLFNFIHYPKVSEPLNQIIALFLYLTIE